jgi:hypothetical protein
MRQLNSIYTFHLTKILFITILSSMSHTPSVLCEISGSHGCEYKYGCLLGSGAV